MRLRIAIPEEHVSAPVLDSAAETVTRLNESLIREGKVPPFANAVAAGVRWRPEPPGEEHFDHAQLVLGRKWGDCDDLAPWRAAELRVTGEDPYAAARVVRSGPKRWHVMVQRGNGALEDPSRYAGMGQGVNGFTPAGISPAVCAPMMRGGRPVLAVYPNRVAGTWHARADLPFDGRRDYALSGTSIHSELRDAVRDAVTGVCSVGAALGLASSRDLASMFTSCGVAMGIHPKAVRSALAGTGGETLSSRDWQRAVCVGQMLCGQPPSWSYHDFIRF